MAISILWLTSFTSNDLLDHYYYRDKINYTSYLNSNFLLLRLNLIMKRHPALQHLSHQHHHSLALCLRILRNPERNYQTEIMAHQANLEKHFCEEEQLFEPFWAHLPDVHLHTRFQQEHAQLRHLLTHAQFHLPQWNKTFATLLREHARFEERELFAAITQFFQ